MMKWAKDCREAPPNVRYTLRVRSSVKQNAVPASLRVSCPREAIAERLTQPKAMELTGRGESEGRCIDINGEGNETNMGK
uniref:Fibronectin type-III domain-containing protein n=1 Tax=Panagrellus redivivus TaxID=6233 RepID=A0A7E4ULE4_PANRE